MDRDVQALAFGCVGIMKQANPREAITCLIGIAVVVMPRPCCNDITPVFAQQPSQRHVLSDPCTVVEHQQVIVKAPVASVFKLPDITHTGLKQSVCLQVLEETLTMLAGQFGGYRRFGIIAIRQVNPDSQQSGMLFK
ncbi:hypothetical protein YERSI8AC_680009 [Enterobacterales bacterium 8AC]|nr:hypothetical protein YERSI8AC_680009 [Enterobacterales bacterium 8AC]